VAKADGNDLVNETTETNNTRYRQIQIGGDLVVSALNVPSTGGPGSAIVVTDTIKNQGAAPIGTSTTRFYLSTNSGLDTADTLLAGSRDVSGLDPGASNSGPTTLTLPNPLSTGTYYIIAKADADGAAPETSETNNTTSRSILIGGDLVVSALNVPSLAAAGSAVVVSDTTKNQGGAPIGTSTTRFYLSTNTVLDTADTQLAGSRDIAVLEPGASNSGPTTLTLPDPLQPAAYYIIAKADADGTARETSETNNTKYRQILIGGDVVVSAFTVPLKGGAGSPLTITDTTNQGSGAVGPSVTRFYFSTNASFDGTDTWLGNRAVLDLASGAASTATTIVNIPSNVAAGTYYLIARADADAGIIETNESNNNAARSVTIGSDLVLSVSLTTVKAAASLSLDFSETVTNQGGGAATPSVTRYYLSTNSTLSTDDVLLEGSRVVPGLPAGGSSAGSTTVLLPAGVAPGFSYIIARADGDDTVNETIESNNTTSRRISIGPDLIVSASAPSSVAAGSSLNVTDTVINQGADRAAPTVTRFYLSTNTVLDAADMALGPGRAVPSIAAGASNPGTTAVTIPATTAFGTYYLIVKADGDNAVGESYETNNVSARWIQVTAAPQVTETVLR
jgi:subtilase family serine protease